MISGPLRQRDAAALLEEVIRPLQELSEVESA